MFRYSPITFRLFLMLLLLIGGIFGSIYGLTVPLIKSNVFKLEMNANRQVLNIVYELASRMHFGTESYIEQALDAQEQGLKAVVDVTDSYITAAVVRGQQSGLDEQVIWQNIFSDLSELKFGNNNYIWVSDMNGTLLSHPDKRPDHEIALDHKAGSVESAFPSLVNKAVKQGEGFYQHQGYRLNDTTPIDKYAYVRTLPQWGIVIGAGVYADELDKNTKSYKERLLVELGQALESVKIASNGYLYVFDSNGNMVFHPNANIHGKNFKTLLNPVTGNPIYQDLIAVSDTGEELFYKWDSPTDPGNYAYEKLSLVRHLPGFDWYISSSVYLDDLKDSSVQLGQLLLAVFVLGLLLTTMAAFLFAEWLTSPIRQLSATAYKISRGNLSAKTGIKRADELGLLAESFDLMVDRLGDNIRTLNSRVELRTAELSASNTQLREAVSSLEMAKRNLSISEARQRLILDALPAQVAYIDNQCRYIFVNREYAQALKAQKATLVGELLSEALAAETYHAIKDYIQQALAGEKVLYEHQPEGQVTAKITRSILLPFYGEQGEQAEGVLILSMDITAEKESEKRMAEASKMHAVGQMSGGMAHDFNNLLTIILGNLLELQSHTDLPQPLIKNLQPALRATRRGADLTKRLLAFARRQPLSPDDIKPSVLIEDVIGLLSAPLPENIQIETQTDSEVPVVHVDAAQMEDALVNLALNAADFMDKGGVLEFQVARFSCQEKLGPGESVFDEPVLPGDYARLCVKDTGTGFSEEALNKAFEPFFTTRTAGAGSGLGLSMVYGFVKQSRGYIRIANRTGGGAVVEMLLPAAEPALSPLSVCPVESAGLVAGAGLGSMVLLVEDNLDVRSVVRNQLTEMGFSVVEAGTADEADKLLNHLSGLAGIVTDMMMPGKKTGYDIAHRVKVDYPSAFVVVMTGYSELYAEPDIEFTLLQKPFDPVALTKAIFPDLQKV
ncbi:MAG: cache domain-containing protein [Pontibacterium sp.]